MAGGSQIIISSDGITIKTPKEFKVFAGQHKFEGGQQVPVPQTSLPTFQTPFSNRVDYSWKASSLGEKEIFILVHDFNLCTANLRTDSSRSLRERCTCREGTSPVSKI